MNRNKDKGQQTVNLPGFTKGPWEFRSHFDIGAWVPRGDGSYIRIAYADNCFEQCQGLDNFEQRAHAMREANARLIAAAPDLFGALSAAVMETNKRGFPADHARWKGIVEEMNAALAKANGEQP